MAEPCRIGNPIPKIHPWIIHGSSPKDQARIVWSTGLTPQNSGQKPISPHIFWVVASTHLKNISHFFSTSQRSNRPSASPAPSVTREKTNDETSISHQKDLKGGIAFGECMLTTMQQDDSKAFESNGLNQRARSQQVTCR